MSFYLLRKQAESKLGIAGREASKPFHARVETIMSELAKAGTRIETIFMGNGVWTFDGPEFAVIGDSGYGDKGETAKIVDLSDYNSRSTWKPRGWTHKHFQLLEELHNILDYITDEPWLQIKDFKGT